jgi:hypothetical protein
MKLAGTIQFSYPILRIISIIIDFSSVYLMHYGTLTNGVLATTTIGFFLPHNFQIFNLVLSYIHISRVSGVKAAGA